MALESILYFATELVFYFKMTTNVHFMSNLLFCKFYPRFFLKEATYILKNLKITSYSIHSQYLITWETFLFLYFAIKCDLAYIVLKLMSDFSKISNFQ